MNLVRFDPFSMTRDLDRVFEEFSRWPARGPWVPRVDVFERDQSLIVRTEVPGVDPDSVEVSIENSTLVISGSRAFEQETDEHGYHRKEIFEGEFRRTILLPEGVDTEQVTAQYREGILEVVLPKRPEVLPKKVEVKVNR
jgi:HSP20 family protein